MACRRDFLAELHEAKSPLLECFEWMHRGDLDEARFCYVRHFAPERLNDEDWWGDLDGFLFNPVVSKAPFCVSHWEHRRCSSTTVACQISPLSSSIVAHFISITDSPTATSQSSIPMVLKRLATGWVERPSRCPCGSGMIEVDTRCDHQEQPPPLLILSLSRYSTTVRFVDEAFLPMELVWPETDPRAHRYELQGIIMSNGRHFVAKLFVDSSLWETAPFSTGWLFYDDRTKVKREVLIKVKDCNGALRPSLRSPPRYFVSALVYARRALGPL